jgi:two-component system chemotaxis sensor kinase CheA
MPNEEMAQYLGVFLDEASEQLDVLERAILDLEHNSTAELLQEIFRAAHTLKGSSRAMGFISMGELTHAMEDVFDKLRHGELAVSHGLVDTLFQGLDLLKALKEEIASAGESSTDTAEITARLRAVLDGAAPAESGTAGPAAESSAFRHGALSETARMAALEARAAGCDVYRLTVSVAHDCAMKSVRALMTLQSLETIGSILDTTPGEEAIENEEFGHEFGLAFATERPAEDVRSLCLSIAEITEVDIQPLESSHSGPASPALATVNVPGHDERVADLGPEARGKSPEEVKKAAPAQSQTVRVDVNRLDNLLNLVGELVIDQTRIAQLSGRLEDRFSNDLLIDQLQEAAAHFGRITLEMQEEIMKARMLPNDHVFNRFPRMIRDLAQKLGKDVDFVVSGRETELDRSVIEVIGDPLIHLLRNSVDHGIEGPADRRDTGKPEKGSVWLRARHEENHIVIEIEDDGKGLDPDRLRRRAVENGSLTPEAAARLSDREAINLIFGSGFSTAETVTDVSGRGVGMDIVKSNLTRFGALLDVDSRVGRGTKFTIKLPLTLAIIRGLLVKVSSGVYAVPLASVLETIRIPASQVHVVNHREVFVQRGSTLPLVRLHELFHGGTAVVETRGNHARKSDSLTLESAQDVEEKKREQTYYVVVVGVGDRQVGLVVESLLGEQEIVIKSLGKFVGDVRGISGATILGDGSIALIVDVNGLLTIATEATEEKVGAYAA